MVKHYPFAGGTLEIESYVMKAVSCTIFRRRRRIFLTVQKFNKYKESFL